MTCSGELLSALADGALSHDERERAHAHLAGCAPCRAELEAVRALKARLGRSSCGTPGPSDDLVARLQALAAPGADPLAIVRRPDPLVAAPAWRSGPAVAPVSRRPAGTSGPGRARRAARRGTAVGGGLVALGVGAALLLGGSGGGTRPSTPVDPGSDAFVVDFVSTTGGVPLADPAGAATFSRP